MKTVLRVPAGTRSRRGFTLVELLAVLAIMGILMVLIAPSFTSVIGGTSLTRAGQMVGDQLALARQEAVGKNRYVQVRFVQIPGSPNSYRAIQLWAPKQRDVTVFEPIGKMVVLPEGTAFANTHAFSPLLTDAPVTGKIDAFPGGNMTYSAFRFRPGGGTDLTFNTPNNFITVVSAKNQGDATLPPNFYAVQVDPVNGRVRQFRP